VGYGYANATWNRMMDEYTIIHKETPEPNPEEAKISLSVLVDYEEWKLWRNE